jgi:hypothetical protein
MFSVIVIIIYFSTNKVSHADVSITTENTQKWEKKYPEAFKQIGNDGALESKVAFLNKVIESQNPLIGNITNELGIRDDILEYIIKTVPQNKPLALKAALQIAQNNQIIYYGDITQQEAISLENNNYLVGWCLLQYLGDKPNLDLSRGMENLLRNTKERDDHLWGIDRKFFSWKVLGSGLSTDEENARCEKGEF